MLPNMRSDEKLPRGSYFYIQVGHRFYAGEKAETREVKVDPTQASVLTNFTKDGKRSRERIQRDTDYYWWTSRNRGASYTRAARDERKGTTPTYAKPRKRPEVIVRKEFTGKSTPKLVDSKEEAKQYRKKDSALSACEKLKACYQGLDVKVTVKIEGETK